jgi:hypothetical protein
MAGDSRAGFRFRRAGANSLLRSGGQNRDKSDSRIAGELTTVVFGKRYLRPMTLSRARSTAQLLREFDDLRHARRADGMTARQ